MPAPAQEPAPSTTPLADNDLTRLLGLQRHEPLTAEDRAAAHITAVAQSLGYCLATPCRVCGRLLIAEKSQRAHIGPRCAAKVAGE